MKRVVKIVSKMMLYVLGIVVTFIIGVWIFLNFAPQIGKTPGHSARELFASKTKLFYDGQFHNERSTRVVTEKSAPKNARVRPKRSLPSEKPDCTTPMQEGEATLTWCGHSSILLRLADKNIFSTQLSPTVRRL